MTSQRDPAWSPDGNYIAFECHYIYPTDGFDNASWNNPIWDEETGEICLFNVETREYERLTYGRHKMHPVWSPDGTRLAWYDKRDGLIVYDFQNRKIIQDTDISYSFEQYEKENYHFPPLDYDYSSPNGRYSVELSEIADDEVYKGLFFVVKERGRVIYKSDFNIYPDPVWSPDSSILALRKSDDRKTWEVVFMQFPGKEMISMPITPSSISWSPNGKNIVFQDHELLEIMELEFSKNPFLYVVVKKQTIQLHGNVNENVSWSPNGRYITFRSSEIIEDLGGGAYLTTFEKLWLFDLENNTQFPLTIEH